MSGGSPKPSALVWTLAGQELTNYEDLGLHTIQVEVTRNWNGKILKCHVSQKDDFVSTKISERRLLLYFRYFN